MGCITLIMTKNKSTLTNYTNKVITLKKGVNIKQPEL